jgi:hypothetical protein
LNFPQILPVTQIENVVESEEAEYVVEFSTTATLIAKVLRKPKRLLPIRQVAQEATMTVPPTSAPSSAQPKIC